MAYNNDTDIILCTNCDAEFTVNRFDDEEGEEIQYCPYCGTHLWEEYDFGEDEDEE